MWFAVDLLFEGVRENGPEANALWEEKIVLIEAENEDEAERKATSRVAEDEVSFKTVDGGQVTWVFRRVAVVYAIQAEKIESSVEVFSRFLRASEVKSLLTPFEK